LIEVQQDLEWKRWWVNPWRILATIPRATGLARKRSERGWPQFSRI